MDFKELQNEPRLLIEAELKPLQGSRFQPTGFPDLGAATYTVPGSKETMLLLESAQSVANHLENSIWDESTQDVIAPLRGIPYVVVKQGDKILTNSLLEAHRINSPYILGGKSKKTQFFETLKKEIGFFPDEPLDFHKLAIALAKYDINCLLHGAFIEKIGGVVRLSRTLSGFIEAKNVEVVDSGGVKNDRVKPSTKKDKADASGEGESKGSAKEGYGNVPYHRQEYTAEKITAYFNLDLAQIRSYRLGEAVEDLLIAIALFKIQRFLDTGLRLRTACDLESTPVTVKRPDNFPIPDLPTLTKSLPTLTKAAESAFANPAITEVQYESEGSKK
jgi:CRISPR-associated protein Csb1